MPGTALVSDVDVIVLGSGTSSGIPVIGCSCRVCTSEDPRDRRLRTAGAIRFLDATGTPRTLLIDASPDLRQQSLAHALTRCDGILLTHNHVDHTFGLDEVRRFNAVMQQPIDLYADEHTMSFLYRTFQHIFSPERNINPSFVASIIPHVLAAPASVDLFGLRCTVIPLLHGRLPVFGYRFEALDAGGEVALKQPGALPLSWCTDVSSIPPGSWNLLTDLRTLVLDMLRHRKHPTHFSVEEAVVVAGRVGAERTRFVHMSHEILHAEQDPALPDGMALAWDGLVLS